MKEVIIVAGKTKADVGRLRRSLREKGYDSIPCRSAGQIIEEMEILPTCDARVPLVIVEPEILSDLSDDSIARLSDLALDVSFEYRAVFKRQQNPELADVLTENGVRVICD